MIYGEKIRKWRSFRRMTMPQLSEATGIPASTIYLWEKNRLAPEGEEFAALAQALGVSVSELIGTPTEDPAASAPQAAKAPHTTEAADDFPNEVHEKPAEHRTLRNDDSFDLVQVTRIYHHIRDEADRASLAELTAARGLLQESLKLVRERIKELNNYKKAMARK